MAKNVSRPDFEVKPYPAIQGHFMIRFFSELAMYDFANSGIIAGIFAPHTVIDHIGEWRPMTDTELQLLLKEGFPWHYNCKLEGLPDEILDEEDGE